MGWIRGVLGAAFAECFLWGSVAFADGQPRPGAWPITGPELIAGDATLKGAGVRFHRKLNAMMIRAVGKPLGWKAIAKKMKALQGRVNAKGNSGRAGVVLFWAGSNRIGKSQYNAARGRYVFMYGDGHTTVHDASSFAISGDPRAKRPGYMGGWAKNEKIRCVGWVRNHTATKLPVSVRCLIYGRFSRSDRIGSSKSEMVTRVLADKTFNIGTLGPRKRKRYKFAINGLEGPKTGPGDFALYNFLGMSFSTSFQVNGRSMSHFDPSQHKEKLAWLRLMDRFAAKGITQHVVGKFERATVTPGFSITAVVKNRSPRAMKKLARWMWRSVKSHYKRHFKREPLWLEVFHKGSQIGRIDDRGRFKKA